jgi:hypothetical protein
VSPATLEAAASAKAKLMKMLEGRAEVCAIGIAILDGGFGVKVNLFRPAEPPIPAEVDRVPVIIEVTGGISSL